MIRVGIVDDTRYGRQNLIEGFRGHDEVEVALVAADGQDFLARMKGLHHSKRPAIVLMDIDMPVMDGISTVRDAKAVYPAVEFVMLTVFDDDARIYEAIAAGASGYLLKGCPAREIIGHLQQVAEHGAVPMSPSIARKALRMMAGHSPKAHEADQSDGLSEREVEVLQGLVDGLDYKSIAHRLGIAPNTVRNHIAQVYAKLNVASKVDAVKLALRKGIAR